MFSVYVVVLVHTIKMIKCVFDTIALPTSKYETEVNKIKKYTSIQEHVANQLQTLIAIDIIQCECNMQI